MFFFWKKMIWLRPFIFSSADQQSSAAAGRPAGLVCLTPHANPSLAGLKGVNNVFFFEKNDLVTSL